jgi:hypothetical protein
MQVDTGDTNSISQNSFSFCWRELTVKTSSLYFPNKKEGVVLLSTDYSISYLACKYWTTPISKSLPQLGMN